MLIYKSSFGLIKNLITGKNRLRLLITISVLSVLVNACSKESRIDEQLLSIKETNNQISYLAKGNLVFLNGENYIQVSKFTGIPVKLSEKSKVGDTIIATIDPSLINGYNNQHEEHNPLFPDGAFGISNGSRFFVSAGETQSKDSLYVTLKNGTGLKGQTVYLLPVRLASKKGGKLLNDVIYVKMLLSTGNLTAVMDGASYGNGVAGGRIPGGALSLLYFDYYPDSLKFSVRVNTSLPDHDLIVESSLLSEAQMDSVILAQNFYAVPLPSNYYKLTKNLSTIPKGQVSGNDSLVVSLSDKDKLEKNQYYIMGIKVKHYTASKYGVPPMPGDSSVAYVSFFLY